MSKLTKYTLNTWCRCVGGGIYNRHLNFKTKMLWNVIALCPTFVIKSNLIVNQVVHRKTTSIIY